MVRHVRINALTVVPSVSERNNRFVPIHSEFLALRAPNLSRSGASYLSQYLDFDVGTRYVRDEPLAHC